MKKLYTKIGQAVGVGSNDATTGESFLVMSNPGMLLDPNLNYNTPAGRYQFAQSIDRILQPNWIYATKAGSVYDVYSAIMNYHEVPSIHPTQAQKAEYRAACQVIYTDCSNATPSQTTSAYDAYVTAMSNLITLNKQAQDYRNATNSEDLPADLAGQLFEATQRLARIANATKIETALATLSAFEHIDPNAFWGEQMARLSIKSENYNGAAFGKLDLSPSYATWLDRNRTWTRITLSNSDLKQSTSSSATSVGAGGGFSVGLFSIGGDYSHSENRTASSLDVSNFTLAFDVMRVSLSRPWMNTAVFNSEAWKWLTGSPYYNRFVSSGVDAANGVTPPATDVMPFLPTGLLLARKVSLSGSWNHDLATTFNSETSTGGSFGWGPFSFGGRYQSSDANTYHRAQAAGNTLSFDDPQIIGFFVEVVPRTPNPDPCLKFNSSSAPQPAYCSRTYALLTPEAVIAMNGELGERQILDHKTVLNSARAKLRASKTYLRTLNHPPH